MVSPLDPLIEDTLQDSRLPSLSPTRSSLEASHHAASPASPAPTICAPLVQQVIHEQSYHVLDFSYSPENDAKHDSSAHSTVKGHLWRQEPAPPPSMHSYSENLPHDPVENTIIPIKLDLVSNVALHSSHSSLSSSSSFASAFDEDDIPGSTLLPVSRKPKIVRDTGVLGTSWGISGVGRGFDSTWRVDESETDEDEDLRPYTFREDDEHDPDLDDERDPDEKMEALRVQFNTRLNSRSPAAFSALNTSDVYESGYALARGPPIPITPRTSSAPAPLDPYSDELATPLALPHSTILSELETNSQCSPISYEEDYFYSLSTRLSSNTRSAPPSPVVTVGARSRTLPLPPSCEQPASASSARCSPRISMLSPMSPKRRSYTPYSLPHFSPHSPIPRSPSLPLSFPLSSYAMSHSFLSSYPPLPYPSASSSVPLFPSPQDPPAPIASSPLVQRPHPARRRESQKRISLVAGRIIPLPLSPLFPSTSLPSPEPVLKDLEGEAEGKSALENETEALVVKVSDASGIPVSQGGPKAPPSEPVTSSRSTTISNPTTALAPTGISIMQSRGSPAGAWVDEPTGEGTLPHHKRTIEDFVIQGEAGRGAYGLVKRVREKKSVTDTRGEDLGPPLIMKQIIKSRILADCWKKHPVLGTIPVEIYVMSGLSSTNYVLPPRRPWDPMRFEFWEAERRAVGAGAPDEHFVAGQIDGPKAGRDAGEDGQTTEGGVGACPYEDTSHTETSNPPSSSGSSKNSRASTATTCSNGDASRAGSSVSSYSASEASPPSSDDTVNLSLSAPTVQDASPPQHPHIESHECNWVWREGVIHHGHPSIIPLLDFFEDAHYYYLILPAAKPSFPPPPFPFPLPSHSVNPYGNTPPSLHSPSPPLPPPSPSGNQKFPSDLFDLVERYPMGLPAPLIRSYLGQIADALAFLHARGICHRDIKDENVVLAEDGRCWLIDFGSSGIVKKEGWDTFSGTLDYAGPEILRGERYAGPPQDVWAFGIVSYVLVTGECPFSTASEAAAGLAPNSKALLALEERCGQSAPRERSPLATPLVPTSLYSFTSSTDLTFFGPTYAREYDEEKELAKAEDGCEEDGGGRLGDAAALIKACLQIDISLRPTFETVLSCRYLSGGDGWVDLDQIQRAA